MDIVYEGVEYVMKKITAYVIYIFFSITAGLVVKQPMHNIALAYEQTNKMAYDTKMKQDILCLMMAYPEHITGIERNEDGSVYVIIKSGKRILYDDKKIKNSEQKLNNPDLQDMMEQEYPLTDIKNLMEKDFNPGRIRHYTLLKEVYGGSKAQVQSNLIPVNIGGCHCIFNSNNKAADSLKEVMRELSPLAQKRRDIGSCVFPTSGTFNYRLIAGTNRLSPHSFGTAIDLASNKHDYWKWTSREEGEKRLAVYPREIVQIFEKNNFIWGGKWEKFDILHFEYRPELVFKARYFRNKSVSDKSWYDGVTYEDTNVKNYIEVINKALG